MRASSSGPEQPWFSKRSRNLSPQEMFQHWAESHRPRFAFDSSMDFSAWKAEAKTAVIGTLGRFPQAVPPNAELLFEWMDRGVFKRRYLLDVGEGIAATLQVNCAEGTKAPLPVLCCWHGHGDFGKEPVMGNETPEVSVEIARMNYDYGHKMALEGFLTYAIDWMGCGDRNDRLKPFYRATAGGRDWCNLYYLHATMFGTTPLAINLTHGRIATDFVCTLPEAASNRLGVMGLSGGGTMALWTALTDQRFGAAEIICYSDLWALFGIRDINYCGSQIAPRLFEFVDLSDLQGLLAPLPLLVDVGANDSCFDAENAMQCFEQVRRIYQAAGAEDKLELDLFPGGHSWGGNKSKAFFRKYLDE